MAPKQKRRDGGPLWGRSWGVDYISSEDEDYVPPGEPIPPSQTQQQRRNTNISPPPGLPPKQPSPHVSLPLEAIQNILRFAIQTSDSRSGSATPIIPIAACVCSSWRHAVATAPELWHTVHLSNTSKCPSSTVNNKKKQKTKSSPAMNDVMQRYATNTTWRHLTTLSLSGCGSAVDERGLEHVATHCPLLSALDLSHCTGFRDTGLSGVLTKMFLKPSHPLRRLDLSFAQIAPKSTGINTVLRHILPIQAENAVHGPVLEELKLEGLPQLSHLPFQAICTAAVASSNPLLSALTFLSLNESADHQSNFSLNIPRLQFTAPNIEHLGLFHVALSSGWTPSVNNHHHLPDGTVVSLPEVGWKRLKTLLLSRFSVHSGSTTMMDEFAVSCMIHKSLQLQVLHLNYFTDSRFSLGGGVIPQLQTLKELSLAKSTVERGRSERHNTFALLFAYRCGITSNIQRLSVAGCRYSFDDKVCEEMVSSAVLDNSERWCLKHLDATDTAITEKGLKVVLKCVQEIGCLDEFVIVIEGCRYVPRDIRQAVARAFGSGGGGGGARKLASLLLESEDA